jgi:hypothetical protein
VIKLPFENAASTAERRTREGGRLVMQEMREGTSNGGLHEFS